jgi:hypothetical protein
MMTPEDEAAALRLQAHIQEVTAERRAQSGLRNDDCLALARMFRSQADLIEQGVPVHIAKR